MKTLNHGQQIKVESFRFQKKITVHTQKGFFNESPWQETYAESLEESYAYAIQAASSLTSNSAGKAEEMKIKKIAYNNATPLFDNETVIIDRRLFKVLIAGENYSDPIHFKEIKK